METKAWTIALAAFCALMGSFGQLLFKLGSSSVSLSVWSWVTNPRILGGMALYGLSAILFIVALKHGKLSVLYPVIATSYVKYGGRYGVKNSAALNEQNTLAGAYPACYHACLSR